jgi:chromosome segregation ATPase
VTDPARTTPVWISEPPVAPVRRVEQFTGTIAEASAAIDRATRERDDARAELDNMVDFGREVGRLSDYLRHMIADRDEFRDMYLEFRDRYEGAQCRMDEISSECSALRAQLATVSAERDTYRAAASR